MTTFVRDDMDVEQARILEALTVGTSHWFRDSWHPTLPVASCGVYTIWQGDQLLYVGIAGRSLDITIEHRKMKGIRDRLDSHRSGRRSGDQFCIYVCDRLIVPTLSPLQLEAVGAGKLKLDKLTKEYIHEHLIYRFSATATYGQARFYEDALREGKAGNAKPLLNPLKRV